MTYTQSKLIETAEKHVSLSSKSLDVVYKWHCDNPETPLAKAYEGACIAVGSLSCSNISNYMGQGHIHEAYKPYYFAFAYRDILGRMILNQIKRLAESPTSPV